MLFSFVCTLGMFVIELIATEIENPFGEDVNDLPIYQFQDDMNSSLLTLLNPISTVDIHLTTQQVRTYQALLNSQLAGEFTNLTTFLNSPSQVEETEPKRVEIDIQHVSPPPCQPQQQNLGANKEEPQVSPAAPAALPQDKAGTKPNSDPQGSPLAPAASPQDKAGTKPNSDTAAKTMVESNWPERLVEQQRAMHREFLGALTDLINRLPVSYVSPAPTDSAEPNSHNQPMRQMRVSSRTGTCIQGGCLGQVFQREAPDVVCGNHANPRAVVHAGLKQQSSTLVADT